MRETLGVLTALPVTLKRHGHGIQQVLIPERLREKVDRAGLHGADRHRHVAMASDEDDGNFDIQLRQLALEIETAAHGKSDI